MLKNHIKIAWRNIIRNKSFSLINIFGLAVGMSCCMFLWLYIRSESSYDQHHQHAEDLYLVSSEAITSGRNEEYPMLSAPYAEALQSEYPEVAQVTRLMTHANEDKTLLQLREPGGGLKSFYESKGYFADPGFFEVFSLRFKEGDPKGALTDRNSIVISNEVAAKIFGDSPALNKMIRVGGSTGFGEDFKVTGVFYDDSKRSHLDARFFVPISAGWTGDWLRYQEHNFSGNNLFYTYLRLQPGADAAALESKLPAFMDKYARKELKAAGFDKRIYLIPVPELHLYEAISNIVTPTSSRTYLYMLGTIALFILVIACINFMNLATAGSAKRAKEVGVRKVIGADRAALISQFLGESTIISLLSLVLALGLFLLFLPVFNQLSGKAIEITAMAEPEVAIAFILLFLFTGVLAGSYPAFYLSSFNPVKVLKGRFHNAISVLTLRRSLVVFQFVISAGLVSATVIIQEQMEFIRNRELGFRKDRQIVIPLRSNEARKAFTAFKNEIAQNNQLNGAAGALYYPGIYNPNTYSLFRPDKSVEEKKEVHVNWTDYDFLEVMEFQLLQGRTFSQKLPADTNNRIVVNEALLQAFSISAEKAVGYTLKNDVQGKAISFEIIGVVKDFHFEDLHHTIQPYAFLLNKTGDYNFLITHLNSEDLDAALTFLEQKWKAVGPAEPFEYSLLNEDFQRNYGAEERVTKIINYFTAISIFISCLGLFGLAAFAAQQRRKEIGIRKVLGASVGMVVGLLSKDFMKLIGLSIIIAIPLVWYAMDFWLQGFAYRIEMQWWMFGIAGATALGIAMGTVCIQTIKAARANPVKNLRTE